MIPLQLIQVFPGNGHIQLLLGSFSSIIAARGFHLDIELSMTGGRLVVWDTDSGKELHTWDWPLQCRSVAFAHDGKHLAVGNSNGTVYVLRLPGD